MPSLLGVNAPRKEQNNGFVIASDKVGLSSPRRSSLTALPWRRLLASFTCNDVLYHAGMLVPHSLLKRPPCRTFMAPWYRLYSRAMTLFIVLGCWIPHSLLEPIGAARQQHFYGGV